MAAGYSISRDETIPEDITARQHVLSSSLYEPQSTALKRFQATASDTTTSIPKWLGEWERQLKCGGGGDRASARHDDDEDEDDCEDEGKNARDVFSHGLSQPQILSSSAVPREDLAQPAGAQQILRRRQPATIIEPWQVPGIAYNTDNTLFVRQHRPPCTQSHDDDSRALHSDRRRAQNRPCGNTPTPTAHTSTAGLAEAALYAPPAYLRAQPQPPSLPRRAPTGLISTTTRRAPQRFDRIDLLLAQQQQQGFPDSTSGVAPTGLRVLPVGSNDDGDVRRSEPFTALAASGQRGRLAQGLAYSRSHDAGPAQRDASCLGLASSAPPARTTTDESVAVRERHAASTSRDHGAYESPRQARVAYDSAVDYDIITGRPVVKR